MARNYEKNFCRLNRLWLEKKEKRERRPPLSALNTTAEITEWLPAIKKDLDFCLKQSEVYCYTEEKVKEYQTRIMHLEREYKSFLRKLKQLDSSLTVAPWTPRPYDGKTQVTKPLLELHTTCQSSPTVAFMNTPILSEDHIYAEHNTTLIDDDKHLFSNVDSLTEGIDHCNKSVSNVMDQPLIFERSTGEATVIHDTAGPICMKEISKTQFSFKKRKSPEDRSCGSTEVCFPMLPNRSEVCKVFPNPLGLNYSSSEDED